MRTGKNYILAVLILSFSLFTGWSTDLVSRQEDVSDPYMENNVPWKAADIFIQGIISAMNKIEASGSFSNNGMCFFLPMYNGIYWGCSDIMIDSKWMDLKMEKPGGPIRPGNIKQMFSIMNL